MMWRRGRETTGELECGVDQESRSEDVLRKILETQLEPTCDNINEFGEIVCRGVREKKIQEVVGIRQYRKNRVA